VASTDGRLRRREYWHLPARATRVLLATPDGHLLSEVARMAGLRLWVIGVQYSGTATAWRIIAEDRQEGQR
jgi:hypothetical protein